MEVDKLALLEEKITQLIEQNELSRKAQEQFTRELETRDKRIGNLEGTIKKLQKEHKAARGRLDKIIGMLEEIT